MELKSWNYRKDQKENLNEFVKESHEFSSEQLFGIVAFSDHIKNQLEILNKELSSRVEEK